VITFKEIEAARDRIAGAVFYSDCRHSIPLSEIAGAHIFCKFDNAQVIGTTRWEQVWLDGLVPQASF
jgi:threonine dehydratase